MALGQWSAQPIPHDGDLGATGADDSCRGRGLTATAPARCRDVSRCVGFPRPDEWTNHRENWRWMDQPRRGEPQPGTRDGQFCDKCRSHTVEEVPKAPGWRDR